MDKHISLARELGYEGQELRDYFKRQQNLEREERVAQDKDRELEKLRIEVEKMKIEAECKDKEMEMEKEVQLKKIEAKTTSYSWGPKEKSSNPRSPKLPYFDEHTDKMDSYLTRFESYAMSNK